MATANTNAFTITINEVGPDVTASGTGNAQSATGIGAIVTVRLASGTGTAQNATGAGNADVIGLVKSVQLTLTDEQGTPIPNLTGLKWAWFDQATPDLFLAPTDKGANESTDGSGNLVVEIPNSTLNSGQTGWLTVTDSDGNTATNHKGFAGPTEVS